MVIVNYFLIMKKILFIFLISISLLKAEFFISIGNNTDTNNSIMATGGGNNYFKKSLEEIVKNESFKTDIALNGFIEIVHSFQNKTLERLGIDAFGAINTTTNFNDIILIASVFDGDSAIFFLNIKKNGEIISTFTPIKIKNGKWEIGSSLLQNSNVMAIFTLFLNYGEQITENDFSKFEFFLNKLDTKTTLPIFVKLTKENAKIPSFTILTYSISGKSYSSLSKKFESMIDAYINRSESFYTYWGEKEAEIFKISIDNSNTLTPESIDLNRLNICKEGYSIIGVTDIKDLSIIYVIAKNGNLFSFFIKNLKGNYKFVRSDIYGGCSIYMGSFFESEEFKESILLSNALFKDVKDISKFIDNIKQYYKK